MRAAEGYALMNECGRLVTRGKFKHVCTSDEYDDCDHGEYDIDKGVINSIW